MVEFSRATKWVQVIAGDPSTWIQGEIWLNTVADLMKYGKTGALISVLEKQENKNVANGYAGLDVNTKLAQGQLPSPYLKSYAYAKGTTSQTLTTTEADIKEMSIANVVVAAGEKVEIEATVGIYPQTSQHETTIMLYRGTTYLVRFTLDCRAAIHGVITFKWEDEPAAGTYTYKLSGYAGADTTRLDASDALGHEKRILIVKVIA